MKKFPILASGRLILRQFKDEDLADVFSGLSDSYVIRYYGVRYDTMEATREQMKFFADLEAERTGLWWAVCCAVDGTFYGAGGFNNWSHIHHKAEVGFWLLPAFWGNGIMTEAMPMLCKYGLEQMDLHRIEGFVEAENQQCKSALSKLGFVHEGTMKQCEFKDGRYIDLEIHAMIS